MKLYQALKLKNSLVNEIKKTELRMNTHNSVLKGNPQQYNMQELAENLNQKVVQLTELKAKLAKANLPVQSQIFRLSELKSLVKFYRSLPVEEGTAPIRDSYNSGVGEYECQINAQKRDAKLDEFEVEIQKIHQQLDEYNLGTEL